MCVLTSKYVKVETLDTTSERMKEWRSARDFTCIQEWIFGIKHKNQKSILPDVDTRPQNICTISSAKSAPKRQQPNYICKIVKMWCVVFMAHPLKYIKMAFSHSGRTLFFVTLTFGRWFECLFALAVFSTYKLKCQRHWLLHLELVTLHFVNGCMCEGDRVWLCECLFVCK